jgi:uncharacterized protein with von Willebrand factor type A (vWA) domain
MLAIALMGVADAKPKTVPTAVVLLIDRSGSMQGPKLEAAVESVKVAIEAGLDNGDQVAVIAYDSEAELIVPMTKLEKDRKPVLEKVHIAAGGGTDFLPALQAARDQLKSVVATNKHVILLTDGEAPYNGVGQLAETMHDKDHDTITTVGIGGADRNLLAMISEAGEGRLYMVEDIGSLPKIALKECLEARQAH